MSGQAGVTSHPGSLVATLKGQQVSSWAVLRGGGGGGGGWFAVTASKSFLCHAHLAARCRDQAGQAERATHSLGSKITPSPRDSDIEGLSMVESR